MRSSIGTADPVAPGGARPARGLPWCVPSPTPFHDHQLCPVTRTAPAPVPSRPGPRPVGRIAMAGVSRPLATYSATWSGGTARDCRAR